MPPVSADQIQRITGVYLRGVYRLFLVILLAGCQSLPEPVTRQNDVRMDRELRGDSLVVTVHNTVPSPMRVQLTSDAIALDTAFVLAPLSEKPIRVHAPGLDSTSLSSAVRGSLTFGSLDWPVRAETLSLPFPAGRWYRVIQGYYGSFSHNYPFARYALDFALAVGDTVTAAADGMVIGLVDENTAGGNNRKYRDHANYITLFHPQSGLYTQYVHLQPGGSLVALRDSVKRGQPIGLSGLTGFTSRSHLHFNVLVPDSSAGLVSHPAVFEPDVPGGALTQGSRAVRR
ncbi:MAG: M23 family metallopeptidase [Rhodothermales bacterium]|nr:M23 family metallopeptidase [Rhodothermales bacterium]MBO6779242.1 M23 family metallopeptidase [Rhodothermales bacterium]